MTSRPHHRPLAPGDGFFDLLPGNEDPAHVHEEAERAAILLVSGARASEEAEVAERLTRLAETEGLEELAELWAGAPADSVAGSLWRLYLLRTWVYADPVGAARQFDAGRGRAEVARVLAGVAEPPGPDELRTMIDEVLRGLATADFADVLLRASAFARVVSAGRIALGEPDSERLSGLASALERAGHHALSQPESLGRGWSEG